MTPESRDFAAHHFALRSRQLLTSIAGFAEMLSDPHAEFTAAKRFEYAEIVRACAAVLVDETEEFIQVISEARR